MFLSLLQPLALTCTPLGAVNVRMLPAVPVEAVLPVRSNVVGAQMTAGVTAMEQLTAPVLPAASFTVTV